VEDGVTSAVRNYLSCLKSLSNVIFHSDGPLEAAICFQIKSEEYVPPDSTFPQVTALFPKGHHVRHLSPKTPGSLYRVLERFQILNNGPAIVRRKRRPNHSIASGTVFEFVPFVAIAGIRNIVKIASSL